MKGAWRRPLLALATVLIALAALVPAWARLAQRFGDGEYVLAPAQRALASTVEGAAFPKRLIDPAGREHLLAAPPRRVVSAILAGDEMLARLLGDSRVAGVTYLADDDGISNVAGRYPSTVARNRGRLEELIAQQPDLLLVAAYSDALTVRMLMQTGIPLLRLPVAQSYDEIAASVRLLGDVVGEASRAEAWVADMNGRIAAVRQAVQGAARPRVLYYGMGGFTAGPGSLTDETIALAGGHNVAGDIGLQGDQRISQELAIGLQPEVILLSGWQAGEGRTDGADLLRNDPAWRDVPAVAQGRVHALHGAWLTSMTPYRVRSVEALARLLHPERFSGAGHDR